MPMPTFTVTVDLPALGFAVGDIVKLGGADDLIELVGLVEELERGAVGTWSVKESSSDVEVKTSKEWGNIGIVIQEGRRVDVAIAPGLRWRTDLRWKFEKISWDKPLVEPLPYVDPVLAPTWFRID